MAESDDLPPLPPVLQADLDAARRALGLPGEAPAPALPPADWATIEADLHWRNIKAALELWRLPPCVLTSEQAVGRIAALEAENARLRAGLADLRLPHRGERDGHWWACNWVQWDEEMPCNCGAAEHNAQIDALLEEHP